MWRLTLAAIFQDCRKGVAVQALLAFNDNPTGGICRCLQYLQVRLLCVI